MTAMDRTLGEQVRSKRILELATSAFDEVIECLPPKRKMRLPIYLGLPELSPLFTRDDARWIFDRLAQHAASVCVPEMTVITEGNASGLVGLERAVAELRSGQAECCLVGGADSFMDPDLLESLDEAGRVASSSNRWGFPPGEGAGWLAVCNAEFARRFKLKSLARIAGVAMAQEEHAMHTRTVCVGQGLAQAIREATAEAGMPITKQYCDINGERYREDEFSYAILRVPSATIVNAVDYVAPADCWGHTGAATAPLLLMLPIVSEERGFSPGAAPMVWCGSESGLRGAAVLHFNQEGAR
ncbi:MAG TPA: beta-ketoacyl synthase N-terminal-like domain-containing protein [Archangium sp.]|uniref:beta-ketoacyl synthase N-terminal-like domain-containing protein n=1 Tax=Archangium sp. TaxID=1872627 RepID=UPI002E2F30BB|nr:beta-ketoacyl synthase N-terminal-like domain-containing protein [Archangium sp.]HEX5745796.1 beta-ketoacyl synthase N-terminal-like domain-containing protein [Archangium sp.]